MIGPAPMTRMELMSVRLGISGSYRSNSPPPFGGGLGGGIRRMTAKRLTPVAQRLRREPTDAEKRLWSRLRGKQLGIQFTRQYQIGNFVVDFACRRLKLAIECDGGQHADNAADDERTRMIESYGYRVIRFWNNEVLQNTDGVVLRIAEELALNANRDAWFEDDPSE